MHCTQHQIILRHNPAYIIYAAAKIAWDIVAPAHMHRTYRFLRNPIAQAVFTLSVPPNLPAAPVINRAPIRELIRARLPNISTKITCLACATHAYSRHTTASKAPPAAAFAQTRAISFRKGSAATENKRKQQQCNFPLSHHISLAIPGISTSPPNIGESTRTNESMSTMLKSGSTTAGIMSTPTFFVSESPSAPPTFVMNDAGVMREGPLSSSCVHCSAQSVLTCGTPRQSCSHARSVLSAHTACGTVALHSSMQFVHTPAHLSFHSESGIPAPIRRHSSGHPLQKLSLYSMHASVGWSTCGISALHSFAQFCKLQS